LVIHPRGGEIDRVDKTHARRRCDNDQRSCGTIVHGAAGLEAWAGTPGTVGGAIFGNAHFGGRLIGELVDSVRLVARDGVRRTLPASEMAFGYDRSRLQDTGDILLSADFVVADGEPDRLRAVARESLAFRKRTQPLDTPSAGCVFQNPEPGRDRMPEGIAGRRARSSIALAQLPESAAPRFRRHMATSSSTTASAQARDIRRLIDRCRSTVKERFGVELREEIVYLGDFEER
jgi:UDP-N-acetylmuramate dehydrogenase